MKLRFLLALGSMLAVLPGVPVYAATTIGSNITTDGNITVNGNTTLGNASGDTITVNGGMAASSTAQITGAARLYSTLTVDGAVAASSTLQSTGAARLYSTLTVDSTSTLSATSTHSGVVNALGATGAPTYTFSGDLDTGVWSAGANLLNFTTGGSERLRIDASGNLGIGTTSPMAVLSVNSGQIVGAAGSAAAPTYGFSVDADVGMFRAAADELAFSTAGSERVRINSSGNLGIGTTTPNSLLQVGNTGTRQLLITDTNGGTDLKHMYLESADGSLRFGKLNDALATATEFFRVDTNGNLGIGTTTPNSLLQIGNTGTRQILLTDTNGSTDLKHMYLESADGTLRFGEFDDALATATERLRIDASGNIGIGTSTPNTFLHVAGATRPHFILSDTGGGTDLKHVYASSTAGSLSFGVLNDALAAFTERMRLTNGGNLGIGTTSPGRLLSTVGDVLFSSAATTSVRIHSTGTTRGGCLELTAADGSTVFHAYATTTGPLILNSGSCK